MCSPARHRPLLAIAALLGLFAQPAPGQEAEAVAAPTKKVELPNTWYAQNVAQTQRGLNVTHFWSKDSMLRAETVIQGHRAVTIVTKDTYYAYDALLRNGVAIQRSKLAVSQDAERERPFGNELEAMLRQGAEKVRKEALGGQAAELYQVTSKQGRKRVWVTQEKPRLPMRVEMYRRATSSDVWTQYMSWRSGFPIVDDFFRPEPGIDFLLLSYADYVAKQAEREPTGPVPVLYGDLLHGY